MADKKIPLSDEAIILSKIGTEFEKLGDDAKARAVGWLSAAINKEGVGSITKGIEGSRSGSAQSISELWTAKKPQNNYQKITLIVGYLYNTGKKEVTNEEISEKWAEVEPPPSDQVIINAVNHCKQPYHYLTTVSQGICRLGLRGHQLFKAMPNVPQELLGRAKKAKHKKSNK